MVNAARRPFSSRRSSSALWASSGGASRTCFRLSSRSWRVSSSSAMRARWCSISSTRALRCWSSMKKTHPDVAMCGVSRIAHPLSVRNVTAPTSSPLPPSWKLAHTAQVADEVALGAGGLEDVAHREADRRDLHFGRLEEVPHVVVADAVAHDLAEAPRRADLARVAAGVARSGVADLHFVALLRDADLREGVDAPEVGAASGPVALARAEVEAHEAVGAPRLARDGLGDDVSADRVDERGVRSVLALEGERADLPGHDLGGVERPPPEPRSGRHVEGPAEFRRALERGRRGDVSDRAHLRVVDEDRDEERVALLRHVRAPAGLFRH